MKKVPLISVSATQDPDSIYSGAFSSAGLEESSCHHVDVGPESWVPTWHQWDKMKLDTDSTQGQKSQNKINENKKTYLLWISKSSSIQES